MQQIAVLSDVHGNLPALQAVLADIDARGIERIFCLGDLAGKGPDGARVVDICRERCDVMVRGNWDEMLDRPHDSTLMDWYRDELGPERCAYVGSLPFAHDFVLSGQNVRLLHASPQDIFHRVHQAGPIEPILAMFETTELTDPAFVPDVVGYADIHTAYVRSFRGQVLFNVGSVGNPLDLTLATYAILEGEPGTSAGARFGIQIVRVPYDIERALADARRAGLPEYAAYEFELTTARYRRSMPQPVSPAT
jgi:protein phosphatase